MVWGSSFRGQPLLEGKLGGTNGARAGAARSSRNAAAEILTVASTVLRLISREEQTQPKVTSEAHRDRTADWLGELDIEPRQTVALRAVVPC